MSPEAAGLGEHIRNELLSSLNIQGRTEQLQQEIIQAVNDRRYEDAGTLIEQAALLEQFPDELRTHLGGLTNILDKYGLGKENVEVSGYTDQPQIEPTPESDESIYVKDAFPKMLLNLIALDDDGFCIYDCWDVLTPSLKKQYRADPTSLNKALNYFSVRRSTEVMRRFGKRADELSSQLDHSPTMAEIVFGDSRDKEGTAWGEFFAQVRTHFGLLTYEDFCTQVLYRPLLDSQKLASKVGTEIDMSVINKVASTIGLFNPHLLTRALKHVHDNPNKYDINNPQHILAVYRDLGSAQATAPETGLDGGIKPSNISPCAECLLSYRLRDRENRAKIEQIFGKSLQTIAAETSGWSPDQDCVKALTQSIDTNSPPVNVGASHKKAAFRIINRVIDRLGNNRQGWSLRQIPEQYPAFRLLSALMVEANGDPTKILALKETLFRIKNMEYKVGTDGFIEASD